MAYKVIDKLQNNKVIESHTRWEDAYRALMILTAHEVLNGRKAHYATDPEMIQAATPSLDELRLPSWAYDALMNAADDDKLAEIKKTLDAEVKLSDEVNAELAAEEKAGDIVAKQVQEGKVVISPDGEVLARETFMKKYALEGETLEDAQKRIIEEACNACQGARVMPKDAGPNATTADTVPAPHSCGKPDEEPSDGARRAALRNPGYEGMSAREQWEEDKALGILDWDGD